MSELAFNINGEAFEVPANATGWRVRRMRAKGSPEVVYGRDGLPLVLAIDAELDDLKAEVNVSGRYRLDLVDQNNKAIADVPSGYVQVNPDAAPTAAGSPTASTSAFPFKPSDNIVIEAMRTQSAMALAVIERFPQMMESAAILLRAADGAGLPARPPMALESDRDDDDDDDDDEDEGDGGDDGVPGAFDLNALMAQLAPVILAAISTGKLKIPDLGSLFDWRKASKKGKAQAEESPTAPAATPPTTDTSPEPAMPPLDAGAMAHVIAIQSALEPDEVAYVQAVAKELSPAELRGWFDELGKLSVPDAVTRIRGLIAGQAQTGGVS